jgi:hypothetical protein
VVPDRRKAPLSEITTAIEVTDSGVLIMFVPFSGWQDLARIIRSALSGGGRPGLGNAALQG